MILTEDMAQEQHLILSCIQEDVRKFISHRAGRPLSPPPAHSHADPSSNSHNNTTPSSTSALNEVGQLATLQSHMQAFKAANPGSEFVDFVRWHSPRDWMGSAARELEIKRARQQEKVFSEMQAETAGVSASSSGGGDGGSNGHGHGREENLYAKLKWDWPGVGRLSPRMRPFPQSTSKSKGESCCLSLKTLDDPCCLHFATEPFPVEQHQTHTHAHTRAPKGWTLFTFSS
jgi:hypothetical protein